MSNPMQRDKDIIVSTPVGLGKVLEVTIPKYGHHSGCLFKVAILGTSYILDMKSNQLKRL